MEKHDLIGCKYGRNYKTGVPLSKDMRNEVVKMAAMLPISEISRRLRIQHSTANKSLNNTTRLATSTRFQETTQEHRANCRSPI